MRIRRIEPIAINLPMKKPVEMAGEIVSIAENLLVRIEADTGIVGWGEAASAPTMTGETIASMLAAVRYLTPALEGCDADPAKIRHAMHMRMYGDHGAKAAIDMAVYDLLGRATDRPVHALLGQKCRDRVQALAVIGSKDLSADQREAKAKRSEGYSCFKIKVGMNAPDLDAERTRVICEAIGGGVQISADANQGWSREDALRFVRGVETCPLDFLEQPVAAEDLDGMAAIAAAGRLAVGADEGIHSLADLRRHKECGIAGVSLKAIKLGGLGPFVEAGRLCATLGLDVNLACKTGETSLACAGLLHCGAVLPEIAWGASVTAAGLAADIVRRPLTVDQGTARLPEGPGLGVEIDADRVQSFRVA